MPALSVSHVERMRKISKQVCTHPNCFRIPGIISASWSMEGYTYLKQACFWGVTTPHPADYTGIFRGTVISVELVPNVVIMRSLSIWAEFKSVQAQVILQKYEHNLYMYIDMLQDNRCLRTKQTTMNLSQGKFTLRTYEKVWTREMFPTTFTMFVFLVHHKIFPVLHNQRPQK